MTVIMTICSFLVPESPLFLYEKGLCEQARNVINKMARMNGSKLANELWVLDKEEVLGYAPKNNPEMMVVPGHPKINNSHVEEKIRNTLKPLGKGALTFATSGDLSPPSPENPLTIMRDNPRILMNMIVLTVCWISISFNKYLIAFNLKHIEGNIFINAGLSPLADIAGHILCIPAQKLTNTKLTFMGSFALLFLFGAPLIFVTIPWLIPVLIVFSKIGLASGYSLCYYMMSEYFPPLFLAFAFGVTQFAARAFTIAAFPISEIDAPIPMILYSITPTIAFVLLFFVKQPLAVEEQRRESLQLVIDKSIRHSMKESTRKITM